ncbi:MAG: 3-keto-5-aminohexanoate cleavage protein, partial [Actinobacteria bacterium]|nr:3-keto-5-aminohexanoate cleavage protein [Actinomycetota bacterium]
GILKEPLQVSCVMGVTGGIRPNAKNVEHMRDQIPDVKHNWGVIGVSRQQWELLEASLRLGGNIRVGVEDNFYLPDGVMVESNGQLVAKAAEMVTASGRQVATVAQAREMLDTPKREVAGVKP